MGVVGEAVGGIDDARFERRLAVGGASGEVSSREVIVVATRITPSRTSKENCESVVPGTKPEAR